MSDLHSIVRRLEALDEELAGINADRASVFQDAKRAKLDIPALRIVLAERRRRAKNPAAYEALQGTAAEYRDALDNGIVLGHARAPARATPQPSPAGGIPHDSAGLPSAASELLSPDVPAGDPHPETDHRSDARPMPEGPAPGVTPSPDPEYLADAARNYGEAIGAIRERIVASGDARLMVGTESNAAPATFGPSSGAVGDIPSFLDRRRARHA